MLKPILIFFFGLFVFQTARAQKQDTLLYYVNKSGVIIANKDSADYFLTIMPPDTSTGKVLYPVNEFYPNGKKKLMGTSVSNNCRALKFDGTCISYFSNGKRANMTTYKMGKFFGAFADYYPNGQLYYAGENYGKNIPRYIECRDSTGKILTENGNGKLVFYDNLFKDVETEGNIVDSLQEGEWQYFIHNKLITVIKYLKGEVESCVYYDTKGKTHTIIGYEVEPSYNGGLADFYKFLGNKIQYPDSDKRNNIQGKVLVTFVVEKDGTLSGVKAVRYRSEGLAAEAVRAVKLSSPWVPGFQNGRPVRVQYTVPVSFTLNRDY
ncbi:TonB family protein [Mucilaginibacter sp. X5P1]|uniref:energy transducer TonB n=1 Tax=Mucilaginibacter sp. X5P1 TaxID=2723088 RepID=UPI001620CD99|nr:energy transducer TonB [Mucilaginibacter sp. X5P1]MBB6136661.1 TonB family protein [Mucilaginibacter sp. X5P1]